MAGDSWPRPRDSELVGRADLSPKRLLADHGVLDAGETDLVVLGLLVLFLRVIGGAVLRRGSCGRGGMAGAARGLRNLSSGFIVGICPVIALSEALLSRNGLISVGTLRMFTG